MEAVLALEDGRLFRGRAVGAAGEAAGEVVFNTAMTGYQEVLTDPSYHGQIVVMTCPHIGNYGVNVEDGESGRPQLRAFVVRELAEEPSSWRARQGLGHYLREHGIPAISEIDTRALTRHIRSRGAMRGIVSSGQTDPAALVRRARSAPPLAEQPLVSEVSCPERYMSAAEGEPASRLRCLAYDFGVKRQSLRLLGDLGFDVTVLPAATSAEEVLGLAPDAVFLSNGPGDPESLTEAVASVRRLLGKVPILGICLGHQLAGLALGARTFKLKFGHHGANHPVQELRTGRVAITSQNHGYAVDPASLPSGTELTHVSLNDGTCEGFAVPDLRLIAVQFHPEAAPGPHDARDLFREFRTLVATGGRGGP
jgi:carbamoyl-phosphate synthase small subunit